MFANVIRGTHKDVLCDHLRRFRFGADEARSKSCILDAYFITGQFDVVLDIYALKNEDLLQLATDIQEAYSAPVFSSTSTHPCVGADHIFK